MRYAPIFRVTLVKEGRHPVGDRTAVSDPNTAANIMREYFSDTDREQFAVLLLDVKNRIIGINTVSVGSLTQCLIHPREVFKPAILANAASVILCHNHPSDDTTPSKEDVEVTRQMDSASKILNISLLDHIIVGDYSFTSMKSERLF